MTNIVYFGKGEGEGKLCDKERPNEVYDFKNK
jgi:hypothetical protein